MNDFDEKTRVTQVSQEAPAEQGGVNDCVVVIYTKEPTLLGKRFVPLRARQLDDGYPEQHRRIELGAALHER